MIQNDVPFLQVEIFPKMYKMVSLKISNFKKI